MKKGILYLEPSRIDRRKKLIRLTETGQQPITWQIPSIT